MGLDFTLRNNPLKQLWRTFLLLTRFDCPILLHYRTTSKTNSLYLSDSPTLSDNQQDNLTPLVRFLRFIGQPANQTYSACAILPCYRTTSKTNSLHLSDSSTLSDNHHRSSVLQRNLFHEFGHVLEGVTAIFQRFIDFAQNNDADGIRIALIEVAHGVDVEQSPSFSQALIRSMTTWISFCDFL